MRSRIATGGLNEQCGGGSHDGVIDGYHIASVVLFVKHKAAVNFAANGDACIAGQGIADELEAGQFTLWRIIALAHLVAGVERAVEAEGGVLLVGIQIGIIVVNFIRKVCSNIPTTPLVAVPLVVLPFALPPGVWVIFIDFTSCVSDLAKEVQVVVAVEHAGVCEAVGEVEVGDGHGEEVVVAEAAVAIAFDVLLDGVAVIGAGGGEELSAVLDGDVDVAVEAGTVGYGELRVLFDGHVVGSGG